MRSAEIAFVSEQLADMLDSGIPLPRALRQLAAHRRKSRGRDPLKQLESQLAEGVPLERALESSHFPDFVRRLLTMGAASGDLPGMLRRIADYYRRRSELQMRFSGLLVYPLLVLVCLLVIALTTFFFVVPALKTILSEFSGHASIDVGNSIVLWILAALVAAGLGLGLATWLSPALRSRLSWRVPPFRARNIAALAHMLSSCLQAGMPLKDAVLMLAEMEFGTAARLLRQVESKLAAGTPATEALAASALFPPMAAWMIRSSDRELASGLDAVSRLYERQSAGQADIALVTFLPLATVLLGILVLRTSAYPFRAFIQVIRQMGMV